MATKEFQRSMRFTSLVFTMINEQEGQNFNQKFENMVMKVYSELPAAEKRLIDLQREIKELQQKKRQIENFNREVANITDSLKSIQTMAFKRFERICNS